MGSRERDHEQAIQKEQENGFKCALRLENDQRIKIRNRHQNQLKIMKKAFSKQCEDLGREIVKANVEAHRIQSQLVGYPRWTGRFSKDFSMIRSIIFSISFAVRTIPTHIIR